jgi:hypothetical protein
MGIPRLDSDGATTWGGNILLPKEDRDGISGILVLDEITSAEDSVRASAYQLLDSQRGMGTYKLPDKWMVIALGNGPDDGGVFKGLEHAFLNRCRGFRIEPDHGAWMEWAVRNKVNPAVTAFLAFEPQSLHVYDPDTIEYFPSPRAWVKVSDALNLWEKRFGGVLDDELTTVAAVSAIGETVGYRFSAFYKYCERSIDITKIFDGDIDMDEVYNADKQIVHIAIQNVIKSIGDISNTKDSSEAQIKIANACKWAVKLERIELDMAVSCIRGISSVVKDFDSVVMSEAFDNRCPEFTEFVNRNIKIQGSGND